MKWYVVYTKPNGKKRATEQLAKFNINYSWVWKFVGSDWGGRVGLPLFWSLYICAISRKDRNMVFNSPGIVEVFILARKTCYSKRPWNWNYQRMA